MDRFLVGVVLLLHTLTLLSITVSLPELEISPGHELARHISKEARAWPYIFKLESVRLVTRPT